MSEEKAVRRRDSIERFFEKGRLERMPRRPRDRAAVWAHLADRVLPPGERVSERELGRRLADYLDDVALARRDMYDVGVIDRAADGSEYWRSAATETL